MRYIDAFHLLTVSWTRAMRFMEFHESTPSIRGFHRGEAGRRTYGLRRGASNKD